MTTWCITETFGSIPKYSAGNEAVEPVVVGAVFAAATFLAGALAAFFTDFFATAFAAFFAGFAVAILLLSLHSVAHDNYAAVWTRN